MANKIVRGVWCVLTLASAFLMAGVIYFTRALPEAYTVSQGCELHVNRVVKSCPILPPGKTASVSALLPGEQYRTQLRLFGAVPVKNVTVEVAAEPVVMVSGMPFGIKIYTDGALVVGLSDVTTAAGKTNPAAAAGIRVGDTVAAINGQRVESASRLAKAVNSCEGKPVTLLLRRDGLEFSATFTPVRPADGKGYRLGLWVRDSAAGVGTLTFFDPETGAFGGLGHAVCDVDTGEEMPLAVGEIVPAKIFGVTKGQKGQPGELQGYFEPGTLGELTQNGEEGLYGHLTVLPSGWKSLPVAPAAEVHTGPAQILTTVEGTHPELFQAEIRQVRRSGLLAPRHLVVEVTDARLLNLAGGIVQGMSGSPIIQDDRLVGAITHVLIDTPSKGYGIFAETMLESAGAAA